LCIWRGTLSDGSGRESVGLAPSVRTIFDGRPGALEAVAIRLIGVRETTRR
jgi:hypothetical protein